MSESEPTPPALTPDEWRRAKLWSAGKMIGGKVRGMVVLDLPTPHRHGAAALALHGQPFGFTHEDVRQLRELIDIAETVWDEGPPDEGWKSPELTGAINHARTLAARIAALLPPAP